MFVVIALLPTGTPAAGIVAFALAGFGCSALLPLTISFGQEPRGGAKDQPPPDYGTECQGAG
jgi:hypothetical protein